MHDSIRVLLALTVPPEQRAVELQLYHMVRLWLVMLALHIPVYFLWGWVLFRTWADFWSAIGSWIDVDYGYPGNDEFWPCIYDVVKLVIWFFVPIGLIELEMWLLG